MPVCSTCNDTHMMDLRGEVVMCTRCPVPCQNCRSGGNGPYCETTPCGCGCHRAGECRLCREPLRREIADGSHYNCRLALSHAAANLLRGLRDAGALQLAFDLGLYNTECGNVHPSVNWMPGHGRSAP